MGERGTGRLTPRRTTIVMIAVLMIGLAYLYAIALRTPVTG